MALTSACKARESKYAIAKTQSIQTTSQESGAKMHHFIQIRIVYIVFPLILIVYIGFSVQVICSPIFLIFVIFLFSHRTLVFSPRRSWKVSET